MGTYLYGLARRLRSGQPTLPAVGDDRAEIRVLDANSFVAVVSDVVDGFVDATAEDLQRHTDVLQDLLGRTEALVPFRFGTVYPDDERVRLDLLERRSSELEELMRRVEGRVEARLKAFYSEQVVLGEILAEQPRIAQLKRRVQRLPDAASYYDRVRLGELVASSLAAKRRRDGEGMLGLLVPHAVDYLVEDESHEWGALTASFLVERSKLADFESAVSALVDESEHRLQLRCVAPLPPYSFVAIPLEPIEAEVAWAS